MLVSRDQTGSAWMTLAYSLDPNNYTLGAGFSGDLALGMYVLVHGSCSSTFHAAQKQDMPDKEPTYVSDLQ